MPELQSVTGCMAAGVGRVLERRRRDLGLATPVVRRRRDGGRLTAVAQDLGDGELTMAKALILLDEQDANASGAAQGWNGGEATLAVWGDLDGGTVTLEASPDEGGTWIAVGSETTLTAAGLAGFRLAAGLQIRATLSGGGGGASASATVFIYGR